MTWPCADADSENLVWKTKYSGQPLTESERHILASYVSAYTNMVWSTQKKRNYISSELRKAAHS